MVDIKRAVCFSSQEVKGDFGTNAIQQSRKTHQHAVRFNTDVFTCDASFYW